MKQNVLFKIRKNFLTEKIICYDSRDNTEKETDNPALLYGKYAEEYISKEYGFFLENDFYRILIRLANYYDATIPSLLG